MGSTASVFPAVIPMFASSTGSSVVGYLDAIPVLFAGLLLGVLASSALVRLLSTHVVLIGGSILQFGGLAAVALNPDPGQFVVAAGFAGVGFGLAEATGSVLARVLAGGTTSRLLAALTGVVATVAAVCPVFLVFVLGGNHGQAFVGGVSILNIAAAAVAFANRKAFLRADARRVQPVDLYSRPRLRPTRRFVLVAISLFLYVGVETVFAGWSAVIPLQLFQINADAAAVGTSIFWTLMATGRYLAWLILKTRVDAGRYLLVNCGIATVLLAIAASTGVDGGVVSALGVCAAVISLGPCYSLILGIGLTHMDVRDAKRGTGWLVAAGAAGGSAVPGLILMAFNEPSGRFMIAVTSVIMLGIVLLAFADWLLPRAEHPTLATSLVEDAADTAG